LVPKWPGSRTTWFGPEVSSAAASQRRQVAFDGAPDGLEVELTTAALANLLDLLEGRATPGRRSADLRSQRPTSLAPRVLLLLRQRPKRTREIDVLGIETISSENWPAHCSRGEANRLCTSAWVGGTVDLFSRALRGTQNAG